MTRGIKKGWVSLFMLSFSIYANDNTYSLPHSIRSTSSFLFHYVDSLLDAPLDLGAPLLFFLDESLEPTLKNIQNEEEKNLL